VKAEEGGLGNSLAISTLRHRKVGAIHLSCRGSINPGVFFRPEEERVPSIIIDDVRAFEGLPVDIRLEKQWFGVTFLYVEIQFAVHGDVKYLSAMGALGFDFNGKPFSPEAPLHEGRSESIFCSSTVGVFSSTEFQAIGCALRLRSRLERSRVPRFRYAMEVGSVNWDKTTQAATGYIHVEGQSISTLNVNVRGS